MGVFHKEVTPYFMLDKSCSHRGALISLHRMRTWSFKNRFLSTWLTEIRFFAKLLFGIFGFFQNIFG